ncbi:MAG: ABC transporter permease [Dehalococcoidia bacterium]
MSASSAVLTPPRERGIRLPSLLRGAPLFPLVMLTVVIGLGIFGPWIAPHDPREADLARSLAPPAWEEGGSWSYPLGTDQQGRDILSRIIAGARISLIVGFMSVFVAGTIGALVALVGGYYGGWLDAIFGRAVDTMLSMPFLMVAIVLAQVLEPGIRTIVLILGFTSWAMYARVLRGEVLKIKGQDYVALARVGGNSTLRILWRYILPNLLNTLIVLATLQLGTTILAEATLSFLGLGIPPPNAAWGLMLAEGRQYVTFAWWLAVFPGIAIMLTVLSANMLGDWLRVRLDPKLRQV